jgi:hypothetical protein
MSPAISVFGALNSTSFLPDGSTTLTPEGASVMDSGSIAYTSSSVIVVLAGYDFNPPATRPAKEFSPGDGPLTRFVHSTTWPSQLLSRSQNHPASERLCAYQGGRNQLWPSLAVLMGLLNSFP